MYDLTFVIHALSTLKCITMGCTMRTNEIFVLVLPSIFETIEKAFLGYVISAVMSSFNLELLLLLFL